MVQETLTICRSQNRRRTIRHSQWESKHSQLTAGTICANSWMIVLGILFLGLPLVLFADIEVQQKVVHKGDHHHHHRIGEPVHSSHVPKVDAIVVGSGLAGMTATLRILDRGGSVIMIEKEAVLGGNSNKASSGINACCLDRDEKFNDTIAEFFRDTLQSAGPHANTALIETLVEHSAGAVNWLYNRVGVDLSQLVLLGGHSKPRTHRPQFGFVGAEIMSALEAAIYNYDSTGRIKVMLNTKVSKLLHDDDDTGRVRGVQIRKIHDPHHLKPLNLYANDVILATGGFASDRSHGSLLEKYRPDLINLGATAGNFSTGDGIVMAEALGAMTLDMEKVQIHPTGFVDPQQPDNPNKVLAAELLRGVGGILLNRDGQRFCDELGRRNYIVERMLSQKERSDEARRLERGQNGRTFFLVLPSESANEAKSHVSHYLHQNLMTEVTGVQGLSEKIGVSRDVIETTLKQYQASAETGKDDYAKAIFPGFPLDNFDEEAFVVGEVTPVLHYCMGGIGIDAAGHVLNENGERIWGLHAAGEVTGGVHGNNRLGGNSLLECAVFGSIVGESIPIVARHYKEPNHENLEHVAHHPLDSAGFQNPLLPVITEAEMSRHNTAKDSWVAIHGHVYDLTSFLPEHPGGIDSIASLSGMDGTEVFSALHSRRILDRLESDIVGRLDASSEFDQGSSNDVNTKHPEENLSLDTVWLHNSEDDCWICIHDNVFDVTAFAETHPGGSHLIHKHCGKDVTLEFETFHKKGIQLLNGIEHLRLGELSMW
ncbi:MAG: hypothetical protein SGBAC_002295 [Bacillariaceae sp.]